MRWLRSSLRPCLHGVALSLVALVVLTGAARVAAAGAFTVSPTRLELASVGETGVITLRNTADVETVIQVETFDWIDSTAIADLTPTREILAVPTVFRLAPGDRQVVRVRARKSASGIEQSYRLLLSEVPQQGGASENGIQFALRLSLPVFITPTGAEAHAAWTIEPQVGSRGRSALQLANSGSAHLHVRKLSVRDAGGREIANLAQGPVYVLAARSHRFDLPAGKLAWPLRIEADTNIGKVEVDIQG